MEKINKLDLFGTQYEIDVIKNWNENNSNSTSYIEGRTHYVKETKKLTLDGQHLAAELYAAGDFDSNTKAYLHVYATTSDGICKIDKYFDTWLADNQEIILYKESEASWQQISLHLSVEDFKLVISVSANCTALQELVNDLTFKIECIKEQDVKPLSNLYVQPNITSYTLSCNQSYVGIFPKTISDIKLSAVITYTDYCDDPDSGYEESISTTSFECILHVAGNSWTLSGDDISNYLQLTGFMSESLDKNALLLYAPTPNSSYPWFGSVFGDVILNIQPLNLGWFDMQITDITDLSDLSNKFASDFSEIPVLTVPAAITEEIFTPLANQITELSQKTEDIETALYADILRTIQTSSTNLDNSVNTLLSLKTFEILDTNTFNIVPATRAKIDSTPTYGAITWPNSGGYTEEYNGDYNIPPSEVRDGTVSLNYKYLAAETGNTTFMLATARYQDVKLLASGYSYNADLGYATIDYGAEDFVIPQLVFTNTETQEKIYGDYPSGFINIHTSGTYDIEVNGTPERDFSVDPVSSQTIYFKMCPTASYQPVETSKNWVIPEKITINSTVLNHGKLATFARANLIYKVDYETKLAYDILDQAHDISTLLSTDTSLEVPANTTITLTNANLNYNFTIHYKDKAELVFKHDLAITTDKNTNAIAQKSNEALGEYSVALGNENKALSNNATTMGSNSIAGAKGIIITEPSGIIADDAIVESLTLAFTEGIAVGDVLTIVDELNYFYPNIAVVTGINENTISISSLIGATPLTGNDFRKNIPSTDRGIKYVIIAEDAEKETLSITEAKQINTKTYINSPEIDVTWEDRYILVCDSIKRWHYASASAYDAENGLSINNLDIDISDISTIRVYLTKFSPDKLNLGTEDIGEGAIAAGLDATALGYFSLAFGYNTSALGLWSIAGGQLSKANGNGAMAIGHTVNADGLYSSAKGVGTVANGYAANAKGAQTKATNHAASAEGENTSSGGRASHSEGRDNKVTQEAGHVEGKGNEVLAVAGHAQGKENKVYGDSAHAGGYKSTAKGAYSIASGNNSVTNASAQASVSMGKNTTTNAKFSQAFGLGTSTTAEAQLAAGSYNAFNDNALFILGNGTDGMRKTAFEVLDDGSFNYTDSTGKLVNSSDIEVSIKNTDEAIKSLTESSSTIASQIETINTTLNDLSTETGVLTYNSDIFLTKKIPAAIEAKINALTDANITGFKIRSSNLLNITTKYNTTVTNKGITFSFDSEGRVEVFGDFDGTAGYPQVILTYTNIFEAGKHYAFNTNSNQIRLGIRYKTSADAADSYSYNSSIVWKPEYVFLSFILQGTRESITSPITVYPQVFYASVEGYPLFADTIDYAKEKLIIPEWTPYTPVKTIYRVDNPTFEFVDGSMEAIYTETLSKPIICAFDVLYSAQRDNNALVLNDISNNEALGEYSIALGKGNKVFSDNSLGEGLLNLAGIHLNTTLDLPLTNAFLDEDSHTCLVSTVYHDLPISSAIVIYTDGYYFSCRLQNILNNEDGTYTYVLLNHLPAGTVAKNLDTTLVYAITSEDNISDSCHTEHIEGAYNISAATGSEASSSRVSHIEGHTNISFGQYNHIEGIRNRALNVAEMTHLEGRFNVVDGNDFKATLNHVEGERNTIKSTTKQSGINHVGGSNNVVDSCDRVFVHGDNLRTSTTDQVVFGVYNEENTDASFIIGNGTSSDRKNSLEVLKNGSFNYLDKNKVKRNIDEQFEGLDTSISKNFSAVEELATDTAQLQDIVFDDYFGDTPLMLTDESNKPLPYFVDTHMVSDRTEISGSIIDKVITYNTENILPSITVKNRWWTVNDQYLKDTNRNSNLYVSHVGADGIALAPDDTDRCYVDEGFTKQTFENLKNGAIVLNGGPVNAICGDIVPWPQYRLYANNKVINLVPGKTYTFGIITTQEDGQVPIVDIKLTYKTSVNASGTTTGTRVSHGENSFTITWQASYILDNLFLQIEKESTYENVIVYPYIRLGDTPYTTEVEAYDCNFLIPNYKNTCILDASARNKPITVVPKYDSTITDLQIAIKSYEGLDTKLQDLEDKVENISQNMAYSADLQTIYKIRVLSESEMEALTEKDPTTIYIIKT